MFFPYREYFRQLLHSWNPVLQSACQKETIKWDLVRKNTVSPLVFLWKWLWNFHLFYFSHALRFSGHVSQTEKWLRKSLDTIQGITMDSVCFREIFTKREIMASKRRLLFSKVTSSSRNLSRRSAILISSELMDWLLFTTDSKNQ